MFSYYGFGDGCIYKIKRPKLHGAPGDHYGLMLPNGKVAELTNECGVRVISAEQFGAGKDVCTVSRVSRSEHSNVFTRLRQALAIQEPYDLWKWNCENFVNYLIGEEPRSNQIDWLKHTAIVFGLWAIVSH